MLDNEALVAFAQSAFYAIFIGLVGYVVAVLVGRLAKNFVTRFIEPSWSNFIANLVRLGIFVWTGQLMLQETGAAGLFVIIATALTGAFAIGSQRLASDTVSGIRLLLHRYYKIGDRVTIFKQQGKVAEITLTSTILETTTRDTVIVPNSRAADDIIINHTAVSGKFITAVIPIPITQDIDKVNEVLLNALRTFTPLVEEKGTEPKILLSDIKLNSIFITLKICVPDDMKSDEAGSKLRLLAVKTLVEHKIPFAQETVI